MGKNEKKITAEEAHVRARAVGPDNDMLEHWHTFFERENPSGHQSFQEWLGLPEERTERMRPKRGEAKK